MCEKKVRSILNTSKEHKARAWMSGAKQLGMSAGVYAVPVDSPERHTYCAMLGGVSKVVDFANQEQVGIEQLFDPEENSLWLVTMDIACYALTGKTIHELTSCRGVVPVEEKIHETVEILKLARDERGVSTLIYTNTLGYALKILVPNLSYLMI
jgi:hypothetical protein